ncbi:MAG: hypothetical protein ACKO7U_07570 [Actinomycetota bacterium]
MDAAADPAPPPDAACRARCPMCGSPAPRVEVHGHVQCAACGVNIDPCCGGAPLDEAA